MKIYSQDIGMEFGIENVPCIRTLGEKENLGILEPDNKQEEVKEDLEKL